VNLTDEQVIGIARMKSWYMMKGAGKEMFEYVDITDDVSMTYLEINQVLTGINLEVGAYYGEKEQYFLNVLRKHYINNR